MNYQRRSLFILLPALAALVALAAWNVWTMLFGIVLSCDECSPFAHDVVASLRNEPNRWSEDPYYLRRDDGLWLWIASGASFMAPVGLHKRPDQWETGPSFASREQRFVWGAIEKLHIEWQRQPLTMKDVSLQAVPKR